MIKVENLEKKFENQPVLNGINLNVDKGKTTIIVGESGCGKTVLLKNIAGFLKPDSGKIFFNNSRIDKMNWKELSNLRQKLTMVFQRPALFDWLTVFENVALPLKEKDKYKKKDIKEIVYEKLGLVGLIGNENKLPAEISLGMQKRVSLARALVMNPECVLYDEPTTGLDPIIANNIISFFAKIQKTMKTTSLIVSHDISIVFKIADKVAMMKDGKIIFEGSADNFQNSKNKYIKTFLKR